MTANLLVHISNMSAASAQFNERFVVERGIIQIFTRDIPHCETVFYCLMREVEIMFLACKALLLHCRDYLTVPDETSGTVVIKS